MLEILQNIVAVFLNDTTLTKMVPTKNILVGPVDLVTENQLELLMPQINLHIVSEVSRSVPTNTRDTLVQIDIWSKNSQLEVENIYERIIQLLNYTSPNQGAAKIFWERLGGASDIYETDRRIWHRALTYNVWSIKGPVTNVTTSDPSSVSDTPSASVH